MHAWGLFFSPNCTAVFSDILAVRFQILGRECYDLSRDPFETENVAEENQYEEIVAKLNRRLRRTMERKKEDSRL